MESFTFPVYLSFIILFSFYRTFVSPMPMAGSLSVQGLWGSAPTATSLSTSPSSPSPSHTRSGTPPAGPPCRTRNTRAPASPHTNYSTKWRWEKTPRETASPESFQPPSCEITLEEEEERGLQSWSWKRIGLREKYIMRVQERLVNCEGKSLRSNNSTIWKMAGFLTEWELEMVRDEGTDGISSNTLDAAQLQIRMSWLRAVEVGSSRQRPPFQSTFHNLSKNLLLF